MSIVFQKISIKTGMPEDVTNAVKMNPELKKLGKEELYSLLLELSSLRKENADFLRLKLQSGTDEAVTYYKKKIKEALWQEKTNLREAKKALVDFKKISKNPEHLLELMIFYVENGEKIDNEHGDMYEAFYSSMETMFDQIIKTLNSNTNLIPKFKGRLDSIIDKSCEGWAHKDTMLDIYEELKND
ncbi:MAG TPA: DUF6155 family protein [Candidatus Nanoarchaeia archaeon]|nr:DUF6155 family protein [Candidatus Nanoarchaeia archaeon]